MAPEPTTTTKPRDHPDDPVAHTDTTDDTGTTAGHAAESPHTPAASHTTNHPPARQDQDTPATPPALDIPATEPDPDGPRHRSRKWLLYHYWGHHRSSTEVAAECDVGPRAIRKWLDKRDIPTRPANRDIDPRLDDPEWLRHQYQDLGRTQQDIAAICDVAKSTAGYHLRKYDLTDGTPDTSNGVRTYEDEEGYHRIEVESIKMGLHQLTALADGAPLSVVFSGRGDRDCPLAAAHHDNECKLDNTPENIYMLDWSDHIGIHNQDTPPGEFDYNGCKCRLPDSYLETDDEATSPMDALHEPAARTTPDLADVHSTSEDDEDADDPQVAVTVPADD